MRRGKKKALGITIGTVLLLVTVGALSIFTLVAVSFFHMRFSNVVVNQRSARNIAESALATALTQVWNDNTYGQTRGSDAFVHLRSNTDEAAEAFLSFHPAKANEFKVPYSTNNFQSQAAVEGGNGRTVPDSTIHLVALGKCRGASYRAEALYYVPPYPNSIASSGPVISTGGLLVAGIPSVERATELATANGLDQDKLEPGHIVSNSSRKSAVSIGPDSEIRGDVVAVGGINIANSANILGEVRPNASPQTVPELAIDQIFTKLAALETRDKILDTELFEDKTIDYFTEVPTPLTVHGDLKLDGGVLYCRDDLHVQGQVVGNGAIFSLGDVTVDTGADLSANDQLALVARGTVELKGASQSSQFFNGLVYSEEGILANNITIIGAAVVNGDGDSPLELDNVSLIKSPLSVQFIIGLPLFPNIDTEPEIPVGPQPNTNNFFRRKQETISVSPPNIQSVLGQSLSGGVQISGFKVPAVEGEERFTLLFEGVFDRGLGDLRSLGDLTDEEQTNLAITEENHRFEGGRLFVRYDKLSSSNREGALSQFASLQSRLREALPSQIQYQKISVTKREPKGLFSLFARDRTETEITNHTFDPAAGLNVDIAAFLDRLSEPQVEEGPGIVDLSLNRVFDPVETSRILLWQGF